MFGLDSLSSAAFADDAVDSTVGITAVTGTGSVGYGCVQALMAKVEVLETKLAAA